LFENCKIKIRNFWKSKSKRPEALASSFQKMQEKDRNIIFSIMRSDDVEEKLSKIFRRIEDKAYIQNCCRNHIAINEL